MSRLNACVLGVWVVLACCHSLASASALKSFLQIKRNSDRAVQEAHQHGSEGQAPAEEEAAPFAYTPDAFPQCVSLEYLTVLKDRFETQIDRDHDYVATFDEMKRHLQDYNPHVRDAAVAAFIARRDMNGDGLIDFIPEYLKNVITPDFSIENAREWFSLDDTNGDGNVTRSELMTITRHIGTPPEQAAAQVDGYYLSNDKNHDNQLSWDEYKVIYGQ